MPAIAPGDTIQLQLSSQDVEGDAVFYASSAQGTLAFQHTLNSATGLLTITAPAVTAGVLDLFVGVRPLTSSNTTDVFDVQRLRFEIHIPPVATSDTAIATFERPVNVNVLANDTSTDGILSPASVQIVTPPSQGAIKVLNNGQIEYTHSLSTPQSVTFQYRVASQLGLFSLPATVTILIRSVHQNRILRLDVNSDQRVDPLDVLDLINSVNRMGSVRLPLDRSPNESYLDPDGDGFLSPLDVLEVINAINNRPSGEGEGEVDDKAGTWGTGMATSNSHIDFVWSHYDETLGKSLSEGRELLLAKNRLNSITQRVDGVVYYPFRELSRFSPERKLDLHTPGWRQFFDHDANGLSVRRKVRQTDSQSLFIVVV